MWSRGGFISKPRWYWEEHPMDHFSKMTATTGSDMDEPGTPIWELRQRLIASYKKDFKKAVWRGKLIQAYKIKRKINSLTFYQTF